MKLWKSRRDRWRDIDECVGSTDEELQARPWILRASLHLSWIWRMSKYYPGEGNREHSVAGRGSSICIYLLVVDQVGWSRSWELREKWEETRGMKKPDLEKDFKVRPGSLDYSSRAIERAIERCPDGKWDEQIFTLEWLLEIREVRARWRLWHLSQLWHEGILERDTDCGYQQRDGFQDGWKNDALLRLGKWMWNAIH